MIHEVEQKKQVYVEPSPEPYFIHWLFKHRCIVCKQVADDINEIVPRARSKDAVLDWRNRVLLCRKHHDEFHHDGVTQEKIYGMRTMRREFLMSMGRPEYV